MLPHFLIVSFFRRGSGEMMTRAPVMVRRVVVVVVVVVVMIDYKSLSSIME